MKIFQLHNKSRIQVNTQNDKLFLFYSFFQSNLAMKHLQSIRKLHRQEYILYLFLSLCLQMPYTSTEAYCFQKTNPPVFCRGKIAFAGKCIFFSSLCSQYILLFHVSSKTLWNKYAKISIVIAWTMMWDLRCEIKNRFSWNKTKQSTEKVKI